jgi:hypothetical protein
MINFLEYKNINNKLFVDDVFTEKNNNKIYKIKLKKNKLYYIELIPEINHNLFLRLYDDNEQVIKINNNLTYDEYIIIGNQENDVIYDNINDDDDNDNNNTENENENDQEQNKLDFNSSNYDKYSYPSCNKNNLDDLNDNYIDYLNNLLVESGLTNTQVSYDENDNTFYIDLLMNTNDTNNNQVNISDNNSSNKLNINKYNINNYNIDLVVDNYDKDIYHLLDDIDKDILECDKKIYYKPNKTEDIFIVININEQFDCDIKYKLKINEVEPLNDNIYTKLTLNKHFKNIVANKFNINKYKFFLKKNVVYSISINNCIDDVSMILYNKNNMLNFNNKKNITFKVDIGGYYYLDIFSENYKTKFIYDVIISNKNIIDNNILSIFNK